MPTTRPRTNPSATGSEALVLRYEDREVLERWVRSPTAAQRVVMRSRIVLHLADGRTQRDAARALGVSRTTVDLWRRRFVEGGCKVLCRDKAGRGRKPKVLSRLPEVSGPASG